MVDLDHGTEEPCLRISRRFYGDVLLIDPMGIAPSSLGCSAMPADAGIWGCSADPKREYRDSAKTAPPILAQILRFHCGGVGMCDEALHVCQGMGACVHHTLPVAWIRRLSYRRWLIRTTSLIRETRGGLGFWRAGSHSAGNSVYSWRAPQWLEPRVIVLLFRSPLQLARDTCQRNNNYTPYAARLEH